MVSVIGCSNDSSSADGETSNTGPSDIIGTDSLDQNSRDSITSDTLLVDPTLIDSNTTTTGDFPFDRFTGEVVIYEDGDDYVIETKDLPDHASPYWGQGHINYEDPHQGMVVNRNVITEQDLVFRIPKNPTINSSATETTLGPIGVSINGVVFFNAYAGKDRTTGEWLGVEDEIPTFDSYQGHPAQGGLYHYHIEPLSLTNDSDSKFLGFLKDGFAVYGKIEQDGTQPQGLDACHGHDHVTEEYPDGRYHYHMSESFPYIHECFRGSI